MARARNIKPGFFANDQLAECDPLARLLFVGLWTVADKDGRLEDRPKRIKAEVLPYDDCDADALLEQLSTRGFIVRYEVDGSKFIEIPNFSKHQNPHPKEKCSDIPANQNEPCNYTARNGKDEPSREITQTDRASSLNLESISMNHESVASAKAERAIETEQEVVERVYQAYPHKVGKPAAIKAIGKALKKVSFDELFMAVTEYAKARTVGGKVLPFTPHPATWFNEERWADEPETWEPNDDSRGQPSRSGASRIPTDEDLANWSPYGE